MPASAVPSTVALPSPPSSASAWTVEVPPRPQTLRPTFATVNLAALRHNLDYIRRRVGPRVGIMAVVKADAYGHGMIAIAREALRWGVQAFAVATADEALALRESDGFASVPILLAGPSFPDDAEALQRARISVAVGSTEQVMTHLAVARRLGAPPRLHVKFDTGMGRYGFHPGRLDVFDLLAATPEAVEGLMTHFAVSDSARPGDIDFTVCQRMQFERIVERVWSAGLRPVVHAANSGAVLHHPDAAYELVRPGILLYGANPDPEGEALPLQPVMTLTTRIVAVRDHPQGASISYGRRYRMPRDGRVGILPIGYGDGLPRSLGDCGGEVIVRGRRVPIAGRVCMDQTMVDLTDVPGAVVGDEAVLYGGSGGAVVTLEEVARRTGTIPYEVTCRLGLRVPRILTDDDPERTPAEEPDRP